MKLSLIIPAKNEEKRILLPLLEYYSAFHRRLGSGQFEILVIVNNTTDNSVRVLKTMKRVLKANEIKIRVLPECSGKGDAIIQGAQFAKGKYLAFADADGATSALSLLRIYNTLASTPETEAVFGNRGIEGARIAVPESKLRVFFGKTFNFIARKLFNIESNDTQCGAKAFSRKAFIDAIPYIQTLGWTFDLNLYMIFKDNYLEVPVVWRDKKGSTLNIPKAIYTVTKELLVLYASNAYRQLLSKLQSRVYFNNGKEQ